MTEITDFTFAFQPIVDIIDQKVIAYEALVRGPKNESASELFRSVPPAFLHLFDQACRVRAISLAKSLGINCMLNLNIIPSDVRSAEGAVRSTIQAAEEGNHPLESIMLEISETIVIADLDRFNELILLYRSMGFKLAIDDFGSGNSGLNLLADFQPDQIKLDKGLIRGIEHSGPRQSIVRAIISVCRDLGIDLVAEGVETVEEFRGLREAGVELFQGYLFARPGFQRLPPVHFPHLG
jgi:EAL domain-containing protein (putative c-di-GMP-specific phosphodiesterase class I)